MLASFAKLTSTGKVRKWVVAGGAWLFFTLGSARYSSGIDGNGSAGSDAGGMDTIGGAIGLRSARGVTTGRD